MNLTKALLNATLAEGSTISGAFTTDKDLPLNQALVVNSLMGWSVGGDNFSRIGGYVVNATGSNVLSISAGNTRAVLLYNSGTNELSKPSGLTEACYPIPIPSGATSFHVIMPSALYVGVRFCYWNGSNYISSYSSSWTAYNSATFNASSYNDGTYFAVCSFKVGSAGTTDMRNYDLSGVSAEFL